MRVGILGGGQLARMMAQAGNTLGVSCTVLCPQKDACAASFARHVQAGFDDEQALAGLAAWADVVTCEFENVPAKSLKFLESRVAVRPGSLSLAVAQDRLREKTRMQSLGIPTPKYLPVASLTELQSAVEQIGLPAVLKTRTMGYDGKGQAFLRFEKDLQHGWESMKGAPCLVEELVPFEREVSMVAARSAAGDMVFYPVCENWHRNGMLRLSLQRGNDPAQGQAEALTAALLQDLQYVGVLTLEFFERQGSLLANEMAPRVHNSGHWTIEGACCSQFENHLRAVLGLPLGNTAAVRQAAMVNLVGNVPRGAAMDLAGKGALHLYQKAPRPERKLGHVTLLASRQDGHDRAALATCLKLAGEEGLAAQLENGGLLAWP